MFLKRVNVLVSRSNMLRPSPVVPIHTLCLLSLVFGGLLWPIAWLWAYTRPIGYKIAFGTEKHEDFFLEHGETSLAMGNMRATV